MRWFLWAILVLAAALLLESGLLAYSMYMLLGLLLLTRWLTRVGVENISATRSVRRPRKKGSEQPDSVETDEDPAGGLALKYGTQRPRHRCNDSHCSRRDCTGSLRG